MKEYTPKKLTESQRKAIWVQHQKVADELTEKGVTMRQIFEASEAFDIPPSKDNVHEIWLHFQKALYGTESTKELLKHEQIDRIHEVMMKNLGQMFHIDYIDFPSYEDGSIDKDGKIVIRNNI